jgi:hypothetical protein
VVYVVCVAVFVALRLAGILGLVGLGGLHSLSFPTGDASSFGICVDG